MYNPATARIMDLHYILAVNPAGLTKEEIFQLIPAYRADNLVSRKKMLFRDLRFLRSKGLKISNVSGRADARYRIMESRP